MKVEETLRAMLDGWTQDEWIKGVGQFGERTCVLTRYGRISYDWDGVLPDLLHEVAAENWPQTMRPRSFLPAVDFNDHPDTTTFADVVALVEKAAAVAAERGL